MKHILLLSILFATFLSADTQIVIGTFSKDKSANNVKNELKNIIKKDTKLNRFLNRNNIEAVAKQDGKYFIVTLEPIKSSKVQKELLKKIRKTKFKDAYVLKLSIEPKQKAQVQKTKKKPKVQKIIDTPVHEETIVIEEITPVEVTPVEIKEIKKVKVEKKQEPKQDSKKELDQLKKSFQDTQIVQENLVQTYMKEIIAFIAILVLLVIYIFIVKNRHKKDLNTKPNEEPKQEVVPEPAEKIEELEEVEKIEETPEIQQSQQPADKEPSTDEEYPRSSVVKKDVPQHGKITKENFKEFSGKKLLIAEDNLINQKVINGLLAESGMLLTIVDDGQEVLNTLEKDDDYSVVLMDVHMPNMDGFEATKIIRSKPEYSHVTVVALSGDIAPDDIENMRKAGMQENLEKPLKMDSLYDILYAYLDSECVDNANENTPLEFQELDVNAGIEVCAGDSEFYKEILRDFINSYGDSNKKIQEYISNKDVDSAEKLLLDIIGVTANIGAKNLQDVLKKLKKELHNHEDKDYENTFMNYASHFEELKIEIQEYLS